MRAASSCTQQVTQNDDAVRVEIRIFFQKKGITFYILSFFTQCSMSSTLLVDHPVHILFVPSEYL